MSDWNQLGNRIREALACHWRSCLALLIVSAVGHGWTLWVPVQAAAAPLAAPAAGAAASPWKEIHPAEPKAAKAEAQKMVRDGELSNSKAFNDYFNYFVSQLTWHSKRDNYADVRGDIRQWLQRSKGEVHDHLAKKIVLPFCEKVANGKEFSPVARVNALLMIGELCEVEPDTRGIGAKSLPEARKFLLTLLESKLPVNGTNDALRVAAMEGLLRHIERGGISDNNERKRIETLMQSFLKAEKAPEGRDAAVHKWMQAKANSVLAGVNGGEVVSGS